MTELKPCKFCGMSGHCLYVTSNAHDAPFVECNDCGACGPVESTEAEAIASWNRSGWQPIETAEPENGKSYWVAYKFGQGEAWYRDGEWYLRETMSEPPGVTHWIPLPEPPQ